MHKGMMVVGLVIGLAGSAYGKGKAVSVTLKDAQGKEVGTAVIKPEGVGVSLKLNLHGLPPGAHAIHFHQNSRCDPPDFSSAGPHFNPDGRKHGLENPEGAHVGDMPNITVDEKGRAQTTIVNKAATLGDGVRSLYSQGGTSLVVHAKVDDMKTDPAGNAGDRIACGVISKAR